MIIFNSDNDSQIFKIGEDEIFFSKEAGGKINVAHADDGAPYSHTSEYIVFDSVEDAKNFLNAAMNEKSCPYGWE